MLEGTASEGESLAATQVLRPTAWNFLPLRPTPGHLEFGSDSIRIGGKLQLCCSSVITKLSVTGMFEFPDGGVALSSEATVGP